MELKFYALFYIYNYYNMNDLQVLPNTDTNISTTELLAEIDKVKSSILDSKDIVNIKGKKYINKRWYRKIAIAFSISTEVINEQRIIEWEVTIYDFTVRATTPMGRYTEASASCSSEERDFNHLDNDVRATSQTRATNRAISDLVWLWEVSFEEIDNSSNKEIAETKSSTHDELTQKQRTFLIRLVESKYEDEQTRNALYKKIDTLTKQEARETIRWLIDEWVEV